MIQYLLIYLGYNSIYRKIYFVLLIFLLASTKFTYSQCAGEDNIITVCDKYDDVLNKTFDLFANLNGMPDPGGVWSPNNSADLSALDIDTGIVDLWRIHYFGEHIFTYINDDCGESATVTILLGGYAGEDNIDGSANACSDNPNVNLFTFLGSQVDEVIPDFNGVWEEDPMTETGFLDGNGFNAEMAGPGEYIFTYTVPAVDTCPSKVSTVFLEVHTAADSGDPLGFVACTTDDLSGYTDFDLNDLLDGEDANGSWSEGFTNQINDPTDNVVNIQEINDNFGYGTYNFTYTAYPTHPICTISMTEVSIIILPVLEGNMEVENYCMGMDYEVILNYDESLLPPGQYQLNYNTNSSDGLQDGTTEIILNNGNGTFSISPSKVPPNELVQLNIVDIQGINPLQVVCNNINVGQVDFLVSNPTAMGENVCPNTEVTVQLDNILNTLGNLSNETHTIDYELTYPDNSTIPLTAQNVKFLNGSALFNISSTNFELPGTYILDILVENSYDIGCIISTNVEVIPPPEDIYMEVAVDNTCDATSVDVLINAPTLSNGSYTVNYEVIEQVSATTLTDNTINFAGGVANYGIDISSLPDGDYIVNVKSTQDDTTPCRLKYDFELQESFTIGGIPEVVKVETEQSFCLNNGIPTLEDIEVTTSGTIVFYESDSDDTELPPTTPLVNGEDYFVSVIDAGNCVSPEKVRVQVILLTTSTPTATDVAPVLCSSENFTLADLDINTPNGGSIIWYNSSSGGTLVNSSEILVDGQSYFAAEQLNGFCESNTRLEIVPKIISPPPPDINKDSLFICGLDNPTVTELENLENAIDGEVEWFDMEQGGEALPSFELLRDDTIYYAQSYDEETGCINPNRVPVFVDLNICEPENYGFFIPDGFSPNNDGKNDTFFIPNIEIIFPDFTLEIYNRYGNLLFKGDVGHPAWDGSENRSNIAPNGVYFYIITYNREGYKPKQGRLYLNR